MIPSLSVLLAHSMLGGENIRNTDILPTKGQCWRAFVFPYLLAWTICWTNSRVTGNLKRRYAHVSSLLCAAVVVEHTLGSFIVALVLLPGLYEPVYMKGIWQNKYHNSKLFAHGSIPKFIAVKWWGCPMITLKQNVGDNSVYAHIIIYLKICMLGPL